MDNVTKRNQNQEERTPIHAIIARHLFRTRDLAANLNEGYVASRDLYIEKDASINDEIERMRLSATTSLLDRSDVVVVATVSCIYGLGSPRDYREMRLRLDRGTDLDIAGLRRRLIDLQYEGQTIAVVPEDS